MAQPLAKPSQLEPSPLGTKEYWDSLYMTEITNHAADSTDVGTIWFDDSAAEDKVIAYLRSKELGLQRKDTSFLDVGTGNGHFLLRLREAIEGSNDEGEKDDDEERKRMGFRGRMMGVDYSAKSVEFARRLAASKRVEDIEFVLMDVMTQEPEEGVLVGPNREGWDVVLDKGTFDAISLSAEVDGRGRRIGDGYKERIVRLVKEGGLFVVTSCNWTEEELGRWFEGGETVKVGAVRYKSFSFGGRKGQTISTVCFRKIRS